MEKFIVYVKEYLPVIVSLLFTLITYIKTGKLKNYFKENMDMKFRTRDYRQNVDTVNEKGQEFSPLQKQYRVDKVNSALVDTGDTVNLQEIIQSCAETALSKILAKFLPEFDENTVTKEYDRIAGDLDYLTEMHTELETIKNSYGISDNMSLGDMQQFLQNRFENMKKEKKDNEAKKIEEKSE